MGKVKQTKENSHKTRRQFLQACGLGLISSTAIDANRTADAHANYDSNEAGAKSSTYHETDHIRTYYKLARF